MFNVKGFVNCVKQEVFEYVCECKHVYTYMPKIQIIDELYETEGGLVTACYSKNKQTIFIFTKSILKAINSDEYECLSDNIQLFIINSLAHEMTHYLQHTNNESFNMSDDYRNRAHEIEAFEIGDLVMNKMNELYQIA